MSFADMVSLPAAITIAAAAVVLTCCIGSACMWWCCGCVQKRSRSRRRSSHKRTPSHASLHWPSEDETSTVSHANKQKLQMAGSRHSFDHDATAPPASGSRAHTAEAHWDGRLSRSHASDESMVRMAEHLDHHKAHEKIASGRWVEDSDPVASQHALPTTAGVRSPRAPQHITNVVSSKLIVVPSQRSLRLGGHASRQATSTARRRVSGARLLRRSKAARLSGKREPERGTSASLLQHASSNDELSVRSVISTKRRSVRVVRRKSTTATRPQDRHVARWYQPGRNESD